MTYKEDVERYLVGNFEDISEARASELTTQHADLVIKGQEFRSNATYVAHEIADAAGGLNYHGRLDEAEDAAYEADRD